MLAPKRDIGRLKGRNLIDRLFKEGQRSKQWPLVVQYAPEESQENILIGFSVPKKRIKRAVDRNLIKRRMRAAFQEALNEMGPELRSGLMLMFIYNGTEIPQYSDLLVRMKRLLGNVNASS